MFPTAGNTGGGIAVRTYAVTRLIAGVEKGMLGSVVEDVEENGEEGARRVHA